MDWRALIFHSYALPIAVVIGFGLLVFIRAPLTAAERNSPFTIVRAILERVIGLAILLIVAGILWGVFLFSPNPWELR
jgi:hypothetical protein